MDRGVGEAAEPCDAQLHQQDRARAVRRHLHDRGQPSLAIDIASGSFEIGSLLALKGEWQTVDRVRIFMGDEVSRRTKAAFTEGLNRVRDRLDASLETEKLKNDFLAGVPAIVEGIRSGKIACRVNRKAKFHAKAYITHARLEVIGSFGLVGSCVIRAEAIQQLADGIQYHKDSTWYELSEWVEAEETGSDLLVPVTKSIYEHIVVQSETEREFAEKLESRGDVRLCVKLPNWFTVNTPVGKYNPDWALVMEQVDAHGDAGPLLYLVRETKSTTAAAELRGTENQKIHCGERHFTGALGVDFKVVTSADELP